MCQLVCVLCGCGVCVCVLCCVWLLVVWVVVLVGVLSHSFLLLMACFFTVAGCYSLLLNKLFQLCLKKKKLAKNTQIKKVVVFSDSKLALRACVSQKRPLTNIAVTIALREVFARATKFFFFLNTSEKVYSSTKINTRHR